MHKKLSYQLIRKNLLPYFIFRHFFSLFNFLNIKSHIKIIFTIVLLFFYSNIFANSKNQLHLDFYNEIESSVKQLELNIQEENFWHMLKKKQHIDERLDDKETRSKFVHMQAVVENAITNLLENKKITSAVGVIHTSNPATPLRINKQNLIEEIVDERIQEDSRQLHAVLIRPEILRNYLNSGGKLYVLYPDDSLKLRTPGIRVYHNLLKNFPNLIDKPVKFFGEELAGATYIIKSKSGQKMFFSIKSFQANKERFNEHWGIWIGPLDDHNIKERFHQIDNYFKNNHINLLNDLK